MKNLSLTNVRFGIEIEVELPTNEHNEDLIERHRTVTGWIVQYDHSLTNGVEYKPKNSNHLYYNKIGLSQIKEVLGIIKAHNGKVSRNAGLHIHIDMKKFSNREIGNIVKIFIMTQENIIKKFKTKKFRLNRDSGCKRIQETVCRQLKEKVINEIRKVGMVNYKNEFFNDRHFLVNILSLKEHGTLEFRLFNSSLDYDIIVNNIKWCINFCLENRG